MSDDTGGFSAPPPPPPPPSAGGGGALPQRGIGDILTAAFDVYKANAAKLITIVAIVVVPLTFISAFISGVVFAPKKETVFVLGQPVETVSSRSLGVALLVALVAAVIAVIVSAILQATITRAAALATVGDPVDVESSYKYGLARFGSVLLVSILVGLAVAVGFVLLIIPGIIFLTMFAVSIPAVVVENQRGTSAMSRSWNLVKGHFWHALGVIVVAFLITAVIGGILGALGGSAWFLRWIFQAIGQIITAPFSALVTVLLYLDLRARTESLTADTLRGELSRSS